MCFQTNDSFTKRWTKNSNNGTFIVATKQLLYLYYNFWITFSRYICVRWRLIHLWSEVFLSFGTEVFKTSHFCVYWKPLKSSPKVFFVQRDDTVICCSPPKRYTFNLGQKKADGETGFHFCLVWHVPTVKRRNTKIRKEKQQMKMKNQISLVC